MSSFVLKLAAGLLLMTTIGVGATYWPQSGTAANSGCPCGPCPVGCQCCTGGDCSCDVCVCDGAGCAVTGMDCAASCQAASCQAGEGCGAKLPSCCHANASETVGETPVAATASATTGCVCGQCEEGCDCCDGGECSCAACVCTAACCNKQ